MKAQRRQGGRRERDPGALCVVGHDSEELLLVDLPVLVEVKLVDHRLSVPAISAPPSDTVKNEAGRTARRPRVGRQSLWPRAADSAG